MARVAGALAAALWLSTAAHAQTQPAPAAATPPAQQPANDVAELRKELEAKIEGARQEVKEMREEVRAQMATQNANAGWEESFAANPGDEKRSLELFTVDGYFRTRPDLLHKLDLGRAADPSGYTLFPRAPTSPGHRTMAGANMRLRFEPTLHLSEEVRLRTQIDALDNILMGSSADYAFSRTASTGYAYDRNEFSLMSESQVPPRSGINSVSDSIALKRVYGEVSTPVGILRFGRMGSQWGMGMLHNDGNCLDCDWGDTVDRVMFVIEPLEGYFITPMLDFNVEGPTSTRDPAGGQPFDLSNADDSHSLVLALARRDTEQQLRQKLDTGLASFNYGLHFTYRVQDRDPVDFYNAEFKSEAGDLFPAVGGGSTTPAIENGYVSRSAALYVPDVWLRYERKAFRVELELAGVFGNIGNRATTAAAGGTAGQNQALSVMQFGGVAQGEYRFMDGALRLKLELGFASGDKAPGFGNHPRRRTAGPDNNTLAGDIDGPQYACSSGGDCPDNSIRNFRFNRDYRIDLILWREILGGVTDAVYAKPTLDYKVAEGFNLFGSVIYSRAIFAESTPSWDGDPTKKNFDLGVELNVGAKYETDDGFFAQAMWGVLFPLNALTDLRPQTANASLDTAQAVRGLVGIRY